VRIHHDGAPAGGAVLAHTGIELALRDVQPRFPVNLVCVNAAAVAAEPALAIRAVRPWTSSCNVAMFASNPASRSWI